MRTLFQEILCLIKRSNIIIAIGLIIVVLGVILGVCVNLSEPFYVVHQTNLINYYNKIFLIETTPFNILISRIFNCVLIFIPVFFLSFNRYTFFLSYIIVFYRSFVLGFALKLFLVEIAINGAVIFLLLVFLQGLILSLSIILFMCLSYNRVTKINSITINLLLKNLIVSLIFSFLGALIEFLLIFLVFRPIIIYF